LGRSPPLLAENGHRTGFILVSCHHSLDQAEVEQLDRLNPVILGLSADRALLTAIPGWLRRPLTLTS
jgi:hypothetical protein